MVLRLLQLAVQVDLRCCAGDVRSLLKSLCKQLHACSGQYPLAEGSVLSQMGLLMAAALLLSRGWLPHLFSGDPRVHAMASSTLVLIAGSMVRLAAGRLDACMPACTLCM